MDNYYEIKNCTFDKIPKHRLDYINTRVKIFIEYFKLKHCALDCVELILKIEKNQSLPIHIKLMSNLSGNFHAATVYSKENNNFLIIVNRSKLHYPFKISKHRKLNFSLAHELGHIYLKHYELPQSCKTKEDLYIEELEADEFGRKILKKWGGI